MEEKATHVLLAEDDVSLGQLLADYLVAKGFRVTWVQNGADAWVAFLNHEVQVAVLDVMMPKKDGFSLAMDIRRLKPTFPFLFLTAKSMPEDAIKGLEAGADDYLGKPFDFKEFLARIKALLKRSSQAQLDAQVLKFADLEMDLISKLVTRSGQSINLTSKEFQLLEYFLRNQEMVISKAQIAENIWEVEDENSSNLIEVYVNYLRKKVDKGFASKLIHTQFGRGYILKNE
jgi:two-component system copper resistance phosphate regulon response regulator CusR